jgi:hypothetical protein
VTIITEFVDELAAEVLKITDVLAQDVMASLRRVARQLCGASGGYGSTLIVKPSMPKNRSTVRQPDENHHRDKFFK